MWEKYVEKIYVNWLSKNNSILKDNKNTTTCKCDIEKIKYYYLHIIKNVLMAIVD